MVFNVEHLLNFSPFLSPVNFLQQRFHPRIQNSLNFAPLPTSHFSYASHLITQVHNLVSPCKRAVSKFKLNTGNNFRISVELLYMSKNVQYIQRMKMFYQF